MNTFDGERCQYGALTDQIRNVLRNFKVVTSKLDEYELFLERLTIFLFLKHLKIHDIENSLIKLKAL